MRSINSLIILFLLLVGLNGCRTAPHSKSQPLLFQSTANVNENLKAARNTNSTNNPMIRQASFKGPDESKVDSEPVRKPHPGGNPMIRHAGFQDVELENRQTSPPETMLLPAVDATTEFQQPEFNEAQPLLEMKEVYTLAEFENLALANNPALSVANNGQNKSAGLLQQVGVRPNPTVGYSANQLADQGTDQHTVFVEQEFVRGNKLALNQQVLRHTNDAQKFETETHRYRVLTDIRVRFYAAIAAQRQMEATIEFAKLASQGVQVATKLKDAGEGTIVDVLLSQTLLSETNLAIEKAEAEFRGAWYDLAAIAGMPAHPPARLDGKFDTPRAIPDWNSTYDEIVSGSPELAVAHAIVCEKSANLKRQQVQAIPNLTGQLGAGYDRATGSGLINLQVGMPIPVRNRNCGNIEAARAEYAGAVENVRRIELAIKSRLARSGQQFESAIASVLKYEREILPQAKKSLELSEVAYRAGELGFLQVLTVRRNYFESNIRYIQAQARLAQASANVDGLLLDGGLNAPQDHTDGDGLRGQSFGLQ